MDEKTDVWKCKYSLYFCSLQEVELEWKLKSPVFKCDVIV